MAYLTAEQRAERDELVAGLLAAAGSITEYEMDRRLRAELHRPNQGIRIGSGTGRESLRRLERAGRARFTVEPWPGAHRFRRVWYPAGEG